MTTDDMKRLVLAEFTEKLKPYIYELVKQEVGGRVHAEAMNILTDRTESVIRSAIAEAVRSRVEVSVKLK